MEHHGCWPTCLASFDLDSDLNSVIKEAECGICVPPDDKSHWLKLF